MDNNRRGFFRILAGIVAGGAGVAVIGPKLGTSVLAAMHAVVRKVWQVGITQPPDAHFQDAYNRCRFGADEPDVLYTLRNVNREDEVVVFNERRPYFPYSQRFIIHKGRLIAQEPPPSWSVARAYSKDDYF